MRLTGLALAGLLALAACGDDPPTAPPGRIGNPATLPDPRPVMGAERRIVVIAGAVPDAGFPGLLEAALRARGINARVAAIGAEHLSGVLGNPAGRPELIVAAKAFDGDAARGVTVLRVEARGMEGDDLVTATRDGIASALPPAG